MASREQVARFAEQHGMVAAARHYSLKVNTVKGWTARYRAAKRAKSAAEPAKGDQLTPAERRELAVLLLTRWAEQGTCLHCGGSGQVRVPKVERGGITIRPARTIACPTCGGQVRRVQVTEYPPEQAGEWAQAMARAGDLGLGWTADEMALIRAGEWRPYGQRWTHRDTALPDDDPTWSYQPYRNPLKEARRDR